MIYVTGDLHGDIERFRHPVIKKMKRGDTLLVCGDFGFLWSGGPKEQRLLKYLGRRRYNILFLEGTHDNLGLLSGYPVLDYCGGKARRICGNLYHSGARADFYPGGQKDLCLWRRREPG
jgi:hypothetical protein